MRVLLVHNKYYIDGGDDVFFREVGRVLERNRHEVAYFSTLNEKNEPSPWAHYFPLDANYLNGSLIKRASHFGSMIYSKTAKNRIKRLINDFKPDIAHSFATHIRLTPSVLDACRECGIPLVMSCNDYKHICPNYKLFHHGHVCEQCRTQHFYHAAFNRCCNDSIVFSVASSLEAYVHRALDIYRKNVRLFLFASEFMALKTEEFWGKGTFQWELLRNPFDAKSISYSQMQGNYALFFGRLVEEKGVQVLIRAVAQTPDVHLKIVGDGPLESILKDTVERMGLSNVEFLGPKWGLDLVEYLKHARFVVVPSIWHENFPYVILQSFSYGKAVVGSDRGGIPEVVQDGRFGFVYSALDPNALAQRMKILWDDQQLSASMGKSAKQWVDNEFNDDTFITNLIRVYGEAMK